MLCMPALKHKKTYQEYFSRCTGTDKAISNSTFAIVWHMNYFLIFVFETISRLSSKAMRKDFFPWFSDFPKDESFFLYSNLTQKKFDIFVFAEILQNKYGRKCEIRICLNDYKNNRISTLNLTEVRVIW